MRALLLLAFVCTAVACNDTSQPPPDVLFPFADSYTCTLLGTETRTYQGGAVEILDMPAASYTADTNTAVVTVPGDVVHGVLLDTGRQSGTVAINYDPPGTPEGAVVELTYAGAMTMYFWYVDTSGTLVEYDLTGACAPSNG